jgi:hypothetical protein
MLYAMTVIDHNQLNLLITNKQGQGVNRADAVLIETIIAQNK